MSRYYAEKRNFWARNNVLIGVGVGVVVTLVLGVPILVGYLNELWYGRASG